MMPDITVYKCQDPTMSRFSTLVTEALRSRKKTVSWLEEQAGLGSGTLSKLLNGEGRTPSRRTGVIRAIRRSS